VTKSFKQKAVEAFETDKYLHAKFGDRLKAAVSQERERHEEVHRQMRRRAIVRRHNLTLAVLWIGSAGVEFFGTWYATGRLDKGVMAMVLFVAVVVAVNALGRRLQL
jgi:hypothetical protein